MKDPCYFGEFCNTDAIKCPYVLETGTEYFCGRYNVVLDYDGDTGGRRLLRCKRCIEIERQKRIS